jgi:signal transduction histidine kinase
MSTILIVDDSMSARETMLALLDGQGYELVTANNGPDALQLADSIQPDVILLDVMMPGMNGFEVCRRIRSAPELAEVPIVLITALDDRDSLLQGIEAGADDFFTKPMDRQELLVRTRTILRLNRYRKLAEQREKLREMAGRVVAAQEGERLHISRELHDDLGQDLTLHMMDIRNLQADLSLPREDLSARLDVLYGQSSEIFGKIRRLARDLRPPVLDTLGLRLAFESYCNEFTGHTHLPVSLEFGQVLSAFPDVYNITLYRVLQEALNNVAKHAQAGHVWVELVEEDGMITLTVEDDGRGLQVGEGNKNGIGIKVMKERLALVGGNLVVRSASTGGTVLSASLPMRAVKTEDKEEG